MSEREKDKSKRRENAALSAEDLQHTLGRGRPFAMAEAHKRLRTNVFFSFADNSGSRVIGVTSAMAHEGKSTTSVNLAYDILQAGKRVLLIDADMRLSRIANTLSLNFAPGLSDVLVGENNGENLVQYVVQMKNLPVITCGEIPPNPTELLASKRMEILLETLKKNYEYIIIDLPPVSAVSDALIVSKLTDGIIVVVRQDHVDKKLLDDTVNQLKFNDARIIGLVMNGARTENRYYKYKYKKYGGAYNYGAYESAKNGEKK